MQAERLYICHTALYPDCSPYIQHLIALPSCSFPHPTPPHCQPGALLATHRPEGAFYRGTVPSLCAVSLLRVQITATVLHSQGVHKGGLRLSSDRGVPAMKMDILIQASAQLLAPKCWSRGLSECLPSLLPSLS